MEKIARNLPEENNSRNLRQNVSTIVTLIRRGVYFHFLKKLVKFQSFRVRFGEFPHGDPQSVCPLLRSLLQLNIRLWKALGANDAPRIAPRQREDVSALIWVAIHFTTIDFQQVLRGESNLAYFIVVQLKFSKIPKFKETFNFENCKKHFV